MKRAFTIIELLISISILSIMMVFLSKSYIELNKSNTIIKEEKEKIEKFNSIKKVIYKDFTLATNINIIKEDGKNDIVFIQSKNSIHNRINPYISYFVKDNKFYRIESLKEFNENQLNQDDNYDIDFLGDVNIFQIYNSNNNSNNYLIHIIFENKKEIILKTKAFNIKEKQ